MMTDVKSLPATTTTTTTTTAASAAAAAAISAISATDTGATSADHAPPPASAETRWWWSKREALISLTPQTSPVYVYHLPTVVARLSLLRSKLCSVDRFFYAVKANAHPSLLRVVNQAGFGFECVSMAEIEHVRSVLGGPSSKLPASRILFTPNFAPRTEYARALQLGVHLTIDNAGCIESWAAAGVLPRGCNVMLRVDPGVGRGHHAHVHTAGAASKFGIGLSDLPRVAKICESCGINVVGLHAHAGSGILDDPAMWAGNAKLLVHEAITLFKGSVRHVDLGGGLGVPYKFNQRPLNLQRVEEYLAPVRAAHPDIEFWMEPGRFIAAESGVLLARVTQSKSKAGTRFIGVCAGMNALMRPALYSSYHAVTSLAADSPPPPEEEEEEEKEGDTTVTAPRTAQSSSILPTTTTTTASPWIRATVVGPICESADVFGRERWLPESVTEGDVLLIDTVGAYGASMASTYNRRQPGEEICLND